MYAIVLEGGVMLHVELELIIYRNNTNDFKDILRIEATHIMSLHSKYMLGVGTCGHKVLENIK